MSWPYLSISPECTLSLLLEKEERLLKVESIDQTGAVIENSTEILGDILFQIKIKNFKTPTLKGKVQNVKGFKKIVANDRRFYINALWDLFKNLEHKDLIELVGSMSVPLGFECWSVLSGLNDSQLLSWNTSVELPEIHFKNQNIWTVKQPLMASTRSIVMVGQSQAMIDLRSQIPKIVKGSGLINLYGKLGSGRETLVQVIHEESGHDHQLHFVRSLTELEESIRLAPLTPQLYYVKDIPQHEIENLHEISHIIAGQGSRLIIISEQPFKSPLLKHMIKIPELSTRKEDLPLLINHFIRHYAHQFQYPELTIVPEAMQRLINNNYQGEIKELRSICNLIVSQHGHKGIIEFDDVKIFLSKEEIPQEEFLKVA